ncbi:MAG: hypothetical protein ABIS20_04335 [Thermoanaerobaculia bacterium]
MAKALRKPQEEETRSYTERIRELIEQDHVQGARKLLAEALERGEQEKDFPILQSVLGPAKFLRFVDEREPDRTPEFQWLKTHSQDYRGQWVALAEDRLLAHSAEIQEVHAAVKAMTLNRRPLMLYIE